MKATPNNIQSLEPHQIFVFGSNTRGGHAGGAAQLAWEKFGAEWGVGEGLTGQCYAFPTLNGEMNQCCEEDLVASRDRFFEITKSHSEKEFLLTQIGCGIAGFDPSYMVSLFKNLPENITWPW